MRRKKTAAEIRRECAVMARSFAFDRDSCGDPEGAGEFRNLASAIERIRLTTDE